MRFFQKVFIISVLIHASPVSADIPKQWNSKTANITAYVDVAEEIVIGNGLTMFEAAGQASSLSDRYGSGKWIYIYDIKNLTSSSDGSELLVQNVKNSSWTAARIFISWRPRIPKATLAQYLDREITFQKSMEFKKREKPKRNGDLITEKMTVTRQFENEIGGLPAVGFEARVARKYLVLNSCVFWRT
ncbi:MAG: hypothetical protein GY748_25955 [Planctomycetaceae bacterium]|nr:hypothetical protein [Planctomycetaceae bacterium]